MQIAIMVYPGMTALDAIGPYEVLRGIPDAQLRFVWKQPGPVVTDSGVLVLGATHSFDDTPSPDVVLVPGSGISTTTMMADGTVLRWLRQVHGTSRVTASVCSGSAILAAAGVLEGLAATSHWAALPLLKGLGVTPRPEERIVNAGKVWTSAGVSAGIDLALALVAELADEQRARVIQLTIEYDPQPPFDAGHMSKASDPVKKIARAEMMRTAVSARAVLALPVIAARRWGQVLRRVVKR